MRAGWQQRVDERGKMVEVLCEMEKNKKKARLRGAPPQKLFRPLHLPLFFCNGPFVQLIGSLRAFFEEA